jgi:peroxiredoxin Q/BCP
MHRTLILAAALFVALLACKDPPPPEGGSPSRTSEDPIGEGNRAPDVTLKLQDGTEVSLASLEGSFVFLYFYPKDDTPGCTTEAKGLRDQHAELAKLGVKVFGVSLQDAESHKSFIDKYELPFALVVDDGTIAKAFNVPVKGEYAARHSFLIGKDRKILKVWRTVVPDQHAKEVLAAVRNAS